MTEQKPGYWINESNGVLRPAIIAYLNDEHLSLSQIVTIRAYLRRSLQVANNILEPFGLALS